MDEERQGQEKVTPYHSQYYAHELTKRCSSEWFKPAKGQFQIHYRNDQSYEPDFVVETKDAKFLCEPKRASEMQDEDVQAKARAAVVWCQRATEHEQKHGGKGWQYLLIPHGAVTANKTLQGLASTFVVASPDNKALEEET